MQPLCAVSRVSTKVTISKNQTAEAIVDNELLMFAVSIRGYFANIISSRVTHFTRLFKWFFTVYWMYYDAKFRIFVLFIQIMYFHFSGIFHVL